VRSPEIRILARVPLGRARLSRAANDGVIDRQDRAVASAAKVTIKSGTTPNQKISGACDANVAVDK